MKKVAIIILTYNGEKYLPQLLGSVFNFPPTSVEFKVLIVDNYSSDQTVSYIAKHFPQVEILAQKNNWGFAKGNNIGISFALERGYDYVMLLNQDTIVTDGYLDKLVQVIDKDEQIAAVQPRLMLYPETELVNSLGNVIHYLGFGYTYGHRLPLADLDSKHPLNYCSGAACLIRCEALKKVGLFYEELFMYHEDLDLGWRFKLVGYRQQAVFESVVYHQYEFSRSIKKYYFMERNRFMVMFANYSLLTLLLICPMLLVMELGLFLFSFKNGWWREKLKVYGYFFSRENWTKIRKQRQLVQNLRSVSEREVVADFSGIIQHQELKSVSLELINPFLYLYWFLIRSIIFW